MHHLSVNPKEFGPTVRQCVILVEPRQHRAKLLALVTNFPMDVCFQPVSNAVKELPTALLARQPNQRIFSFAVFTTDMAKSQKFEFVRLPSSVFQSFLCESTEHDASSLLFSKFYIEFAEAHSEPSIEFVRVRFVLKAGDKIIYISNQMS